MSEWKTEQVVTYRLELIPGESGDDSPVWIWLEGVGGRKCGALRFYRSNAPLPPGSTGPGEPTWLPFRMEELGPFLDILRTERPLYLHARTTPVAHPRETRVYLSSNAEPVGEEERSMR